LLAKGPFGNHTGHPLVVQVDNYRRDPASKPGSITLRGDCRSTVTARQQSRQPDHYVYYLSLHDDLHDFGQIGRRSPRPIPFQRCQGRR
jgi:hypothetical protein